MMVLFCLSEDEYIFLINADDGDTHISSMTQMKNYIPLYHISLTHAKHILLLAQIGYYTLTCKTMGYVSIIDVN